jgi:hypothetical protein
MIELKKIKEKRKRPYGWIVWWCDIDLLRVNILRKE